MLSLRSLRLWLFVGLIVWPWLSGAQARAPEPTCSRPEQHVSTPLTELGTNAYIRMDGQETTFTGGLYPDGQNERPPAYAVAGLSLAQQITPLDPTGSPDAGGGKIGFISIGMSNTSMEFGALIDLARRDSTVNRQVAMINTALPNRTAERWANPQDDTWREALRRLDQRGLSPEQVQVAWVKQVLRGGGAFPAKTQALQADLEAIARNLHTYFPNLKIAFFSSRTRSYTYERGLSPEPLAFESGFAVKWMIEKQIGGDATLNYDPAKGPVTAPFLTWGPYLWADGTTPRQDGLVWEPGDMRPDCTHPSPAGAAKVARLLLDYFKTDALARGWFLSASSQLEAPETAGAPASPTIAPSPAPTKVPPTSTVTIAVQVTSTPSPGAPIATPSVAAGSPVASVTQTPEGLPLLEATQAAPSLPKRTLAPLGLAFIVLVAISLGIGGLVFLRRRRP